MARGPLTALRRICLALPETTERLSHGEPTWFVRGKKTFVSYADHHHDDRVAFSCAAPPGAQRSMVASLEDQERRLVVQALETAGGNQSQAARQLRIGRDALRYKVKKYGL